MTTPATPLDLSAIPLVDEHCHGFYHTQRPDSPATWRRHFTESSDPEIAERHVPHMPFYQRLIHELAAFFACAPNEAAVLAHRAAESDDALLGRLLRAANIEALLIDQGHPPPDLIRADAAVAALAGCRAAPILRLEVLMQRLIATHATLDGVIEALRAALADVRARGYVALKSIASYRTGLDIQTWPREYAEVAFAQARLEVAAQGTVRIAHKPLLDTLLHVAFTAAASQELPIQFHTGYGDRDADLRRANPLHLRAVLEHPPYRDMPVVLLHASYPYTREGGYLAAVYHQVHLDLSYAMPFVSAAEMLAFTRAALGVAPTSKLLYSSDAVGVPELHWFGAVNARRVLGQALGESVAAGDLSLTEAEAAGRAILRENALRLYGL